MNISDLELLLEIGYLPTFRDIGTCIPVPVLQVTMWVNRIYCTYLPIIVENKVSM